MNNECIATRLIVDSEHEGLRLDVFVVQSCENISRSQIQKSIEQGSVLLNGHPVAKRTTVKSGDCVEFSEQKIQQGFHPPVVAENIPLDVLYDDEYFCAINKPAGLVVHPGNGNATGTLINGLMFHMQELADGFDDSRPGIVHRIDKDTSGVVLVARTNQAHAALANLFSTRTIQKTYMGFCIGVRPQEHEVIDAPIARSRRDPMRQIIHREGKIAITEYWLLKHESGISALRFQLHTGRTHQIRIHCQSRGFPIVGDVLYNGSSERLRELPPLERPRASSVFKCFERQALHAQSVTFEHPFTQKTITIDAPLPDDFKKAMTLFRL